MQATSQLPRLDRQESMFRQGRSFQPIPGPGSLGQVTLRNAPAANRGAFVGQQATTTVQTVTPPAAPPVAPPAPAELPATEPPPKPRPALRLAWGRLKKLDAEQLAAELQKILERAEAKGVPAGMIARIQERLASFSKRASAVETIELTEPEVQQMEAEILALEEAEAQEPDLTTSLLVVGGVLAAAGLLSVLYGD